MARLSRADRLRVRRALRRYRRLDQRQGDNSNRGALYALYQIANFVASTSGQSALSRLDRMILVLRRRGALLALAIVPMAMTSVDPPAQPRSVRPRLVWLVRSAPISCFAVLAAGAANGALFALGPVFAVEIGMTPSSVPLFTSSVVLGSALGVFPIALVSDRVDRAPGDGGGGVIGRAPLAELALSRMAAPGVWLIVLRTCRPDDLSLHFAVSLANDDSAAHDLVFISVGLLFIYFVAAITARRWPPCS